MKRKNILIISQSVSETEQLENILNKEYICLNTSNCTDALSILKSNDYIALILFDFSFNSEDIMNFFSSLKQNSDIYNIPFIAYTTERNDITEEYAFSIGASDYFSFSCKASVLQKRIYNAVEFHHNNISEKSIIADDGTNKETDIMLKQLVNALPGGVAIYKISDRLETLYYSEGILKLSGHSANEYNELIKDSIVNGIVFEDDREKILNAVYKAKSMGNPINVTYRIRHKNGNLIWVQLSAVKIREENGCPIYYAVYIKPTEETEMYQNVVEGSDTGVVIAEKIGRKVLYANPAFKTLIGMPYNQIMVGRQITDFISKEKLLLSDDELGKLSEEHYTEFHKISRSGKHLFVSARSMIWNNIKSYICYIIDESEVQNSKYELQNLLNYVPSGIGIFEVSGNNLSINYINDGYYRMLGAEREERFDIIQKETLSLVLPEDRHIIYDAVRKITEGSKFIDIAYRTYAKDNNIMWVRLIGYAAKSEKEKIIVYCSFSDVSTLLKTQNELESSRTMLNSALNIAKVMVWKYDPYSNTITDSASLGKTYNLPKVIENVPEYLIALGYIHPDSVKEFREIFKLIKNGKKAQMDLHGKSPDGKKYIWQRLIYAPVLDNNGKIIETIGTSINITEQKEREHNYEEQLRLKKAITNNMLAIAVYNLTQNTVSEAESNLNELMKIIKADTVDDAFELIRHNVYRKNAAKQFADVLNRKILIDGYRQGISHVSLRHHTNNISGWMESNFDMITNPYTGDIEAIVVFRDITDEVRAENVVNKLIQNDYDSIFTIDAITGNPVPFTKSQIDDVIEEQQSTGDNVKGVESYLRKNCISPDVDRIIHESSLPYVKERLEQVPSHTITYTLKLNGKAIHKRATYTYLDEDKKEILCAMQDLTVTYQQEEQQKRTLEIALETARTASKAKTDFLANMSHEVRTPMNAIIGMTNLAQDVQNNPEETMDYLRKIDNSSQYLLGILNDVLDMSRIESGKLELHPEWIAINELLWPCINMMIPLMEKKNIEFIYPEAKRVKNVQYYVDPLRTKQILMNLLNNAMKFTPDGGTVTVEIRNVFHDELITKDIFIVKDTGCGMSHDFMKRIFHPFEQERNPMSDTLQGTGLGLALVKSVSTAMGGDISVESELGKGSVFSVSIPFKYRFVNDEIVVKDSKLLIANLSGKRILLVDDHPLNREIAKKLLKKQSIEVDTAVNGKDAIEKFSISELYRYNAILMDIRMPVMGGLEASEKIRSLDRADAKTVPIIAMTANAFDEDVKNSLAVGMNAHLAKPINPHTLYQTLAEQINFHE